MEISNSTLLLAFSMLAYTACAYGLRCRECTDSPHPQTCNTVTQCPAGDICYVEQYITSGGLVLFTTGCMSTMRCTAHKRGLPEITKARKRSGDVVTCLQCCQGEFCNVEGCGVTAAKQPDRGPVCFHCDAQAGPDQCRDIVQCDIGKLCSVGKHHNYDTIWTSQCSSMLQCQQINQNDTTSTSCDCCAADYCNDKCRHSPTASTIGPVTNTATAAIISTSHTETPTTSPTVVVHTTTSQTDTTTSPVHTTAQQTYTTTSSVHTTASQTDTTTSPIHTTTSQTYTTTTPAHTTASQTYTTTTPVHTTASQTDKTTAHVSTLVHTTGLPLTVTKISPTTKTTTLSTVTHGSACSSSPIDVCFVLDSSGSQSHQFNRELHFVKVVMGQLSFGRPSANHACLVVFNTNARVVIPLNNQFTNTELIREVRNTHFTTGESRTDTGLLAALRELEHQHWQAEKNIVVLTDGRSTLPTATQKAVGHIQTRDSSIQIHAIGIGDSIDRNGLEMMATDLNKVHIANTSHIPNTTYQDVVHQLCTGTSSKVGMETTTAHGHNHHHQTHSTKVHGHHHGTRDHGTSQKR